jgi:hypothetical protein
LFWERCRCWPFRMTWSWCCYERVEGSDSKVTAMAAGQRRRARRRQERRRIWILFVVAWWWMRRKFKSGGAWTVEDCGAACILNEYYRYLQNITYRKHKIYSVIPLIVQLIYLVTMSRAGKPQGVHWRPLPTSTNSSNANPPSVRFEREALLTQCSYHRPHACLNAHTQARWQNFIRARLTPHNEVIVLAVISFSLAFLIVEFLRKVQSMIANNWCHSNNPSNEIWMHWFDSSNPCRR